MKKTFSIIITGLAVLLLVGACKDETEFRIVDTPYITLSSTSLTLDASGAESSIVSYSIGNPQDGGYVSASADVSWISVTDASVFGQVSVSVAENFSTELRAGTLTVAYVYDGGSAEAMVAIIQYGADDTALSVDPNTVTAEAEGGTYSFTYSITNAVEGEEVSCSANVNWISAFDYSEYDKVSFFVDESGERSFRTGTITVSYAGISKEVTVIQGHNVPASLADLVGIYLAAGYAFDSAGTATYKEWTLTIYQYSDTQVLIDGLVPETVGRYPDSEAYVALASFTDDGQILIEAQFTGYINAYYGYYIGWIPCIEYYSGDAWHYDTQYLDCTLTYDTSTKIWTSDYGMFLGLFSSQSFGSFKGFLDVTNPGFTITKTSDSATAVPASVRVSDELELHTSEAKSVN